MTLKILVVLTLLNVVNGSPVVTVTPGSSSVDLSAHPNSVPNTAGEGNQTSNGEEVAVELLDTVEDVMATVELIPDHFPAQRAAHVVRHYLNTLYGSPYRWVGLQQVYSAKSEDVESGKKYQLEISVQEMISNTKENCSAEVVFPGEEVKSAPQVNASCEALLKINTTAQEEALYEQYKTSQLSTNNLPDSYGHIDNSMKPFWQLGGVAASFVMLNESTENTLYNMAQVANVTQLETENNHLRFNYHILLHEMISQEIIHWKMLVTWAPAEGVNVLQTEQLPKCHECVVPTML